MVQRRFSKIVEMKGCMLLRVAREGLLDTDEASMVRGRETCRTQ
jgi:hypothetical protein